VNDAPTATALGVATAEDVPTVITPGGQDVDGDALTFSIVTPPTRGVLIPSGANWIYTPSPNVSGADGFSYRANDGSLDSAPTTVNITVTPVNDVPVANEQSLTTPYNTPLNGVLTASDADGDALTYMVVNVPVNGTLSGTAPNLTFTPNLNWAGTTSFTFRVNDGSANSTTATVFITVNGPTAIPAAPTALAATVISRSQINLAWTDNSITETGFMIERSANGTSWTQIATVGANVRTYSSTGLSANKTYYYRVRAYNAVGYSPYSNTASAKTLR
jgi:Bacterial Ig domain/Fibronectin type III domain